MEECPAKWYEHTPEGVAEASATAYFFAKRLYDTLDIPVGIINVSWGGTPVEAWMNPELLKKEFASELNLAHIDTQVWPEKHAWKAPGVLYNGMLHSLVPFTAKGFIWYQGCDNRSRYEQYKRLQPAFVQMLREEWDNDKMPFYFTQIAPYSYGKPEDPLGGYMMWAQAQTLEMIPYSGMATTLDAGELECIHPANKKAVGDRLAFLALANDYGMTGIDAQAPMPLKFDFYDGAAFVEFDCGKLGIGPINLDLGNFELAGEDKVFYPATARVQGNRRSVKVVSPNVSAPVAVRYAMKNWSEATLFNNFGIPASPFRSDNW
jgi:sialate O-acetylesterase